MDKIHSPQSTINVQMISRVQQKLKSPHQSESAEFRTKVPLRVNTVFPCLVLKRMQQGKKKTLNVFDTRVLKPYISFN